MDAYARFRYTVKADVPEWRNGRRGGLKNRCLTTCEFDSRLGHQFSRFCKAALWVAFFILCQKGPPEGIGLAVHKPKARETVLRMRELQWLLTPAERGRGAIPWALRAQAKRALALADKRKRRASSCGARLFAKRTMSYRATRQKAPSASSQWRRSSSRP